MSVKTNHNNLVKLIQIHTHSSFLINILRDNVLYKSALRSFSLDTLWLWNFWCKNIGAKAAPINIFDEIDPRYLQSLIDDPEKYAEYFW